MSPDLSVDFSLTFHVVAELCQVHGDSPSKLHKTAQAGPILWAVVNSPRKEKVRNFVGHHTEQVPDSTAIPQRDHDTVLSPPSTTGGVVPSS